MENINDDEDILPNPDLVIEYDNNLNEQTGKDSFFHFLFIYFLDKQSDEKFIMKEILWKQTLHSARLLKRVNNLY